MSPTSSEWRSFRRTFWLTAAVTTGVAAVFLLLGALQGPKLSTAQVDTERVTEQAGQQLRLFANQPLSDIDASQVTVEPDAEVTVSVQNELIAVQFAEPLRYATEYTVTIENVASPSREATSAFTHRFTTAPGSFVYVDRGAEVDEVLRARVDGTGRGEVLHSAPGIEFAAPLGSAVVLTREGEGGTSLLEVVDVASGVVESVVLPERGLRIDELVVPQSGTTVAVVMSSVDNADAPARRVGIVDLGGVGVVEWLTGLDGAVLQAQTVLTVPAGDTLLVHGIDGTLTSVPLADPTLALPIGQYTEVHAVSADGTRVSATDPFGGVALDLATGEEERVNPSLFNDALVFGADFQLLSGDERVQRVAVTDDAGLAVANLIVADDGSGASRMLARTLDDAGSFGAFRVSPNSEFVAIEVTPNVADAVPDGRAVNPQAESVTVVVVDITTGNLVRSVAGFGPRW
ncbi:MAG TPA: hypothetical protein VFM95_09370 [Microcella sp.]|nr:hypothetical protein [Microcella sp.]